MRGQVTVFSSSAGASVMGLPAAEGRPSRLTSSRPGTLVVEEQKGSTPGKSKEPVARSGDLVLETRVERTAEDVVAEVKRLGVECVHGGWASPRMHRVHCTRGGEPLAPATLQALIAPLLATERFTFVELNFVVEPTFTPNDALFVNQWHYRAMRLPAAWDISQGGSSVVVAVIDTGHAPHPDLDGNTLPGIDLISDVAMAADGDGRDSDPTDVMGPVPPQSRGSSWHGLHVAGTIAALTNNTTGVAGVAPNVRVVPVRVLGRGGGTTFDIAAGINWAVGVTVPGVASNRNPAIVLNMSLTGAGGAQTYASAIRAATDANAIVVVAAGNDDTDTANTMPCNNANVICVAATDLRGRATAYTNYGREVTVSAPGGAVDRDDDGNGEPDGVLSTVGGGRYGYLEGTSMATPHVAGLVALMKSQARALTFTQVKALLQANVDPISNCTACGAGIVDAQRVLQAVTPQPTRPGLLNINVDALVFSEAVKEHQVRLANVGGAPLRVNLISSDTRIADFTWDVATPPVVIAPGQVVVVTIKYDRAITSDADITAHFTPEGGERSAPLVLRLRKPRTPPTAYVGLYRENAAGDPELVKSVVANQDGSWSIEVEPGIYAVAGFADDDRDGELEDGESFGMYPTVQMPKRIEVTPGGTLDRIDFTVTK
ncbi:MAG: S8 family serine peptidase [Myxococcus sp.]|nr:S8 family serine peptidase [Myxococcus sp.]